MDIDITRVIETDRIKIHLRKEKFREGKRILDIGGGGEGIISRIYGRSVVAIDLREDELLEINDLDSLKMVMNATDLSFLDNQFEFVTAFFSLMYFSDKNAKSALDEIYRVLKPNGIFEIWDIEMPSLNSVDKDIFIAQLDIETGSESIKTGYGVKLKNNARNLSFYAKMLEGNKFKIKESIKGSSGELYILAQK